MKGSRETEQVSDQYRRVLRNYWKRCRSLREEKKTSQKVNDLEQSIDYSDPDISDLQRNVKGLRHDVDNLKMQLLYQEHYSRRENLMFIGIQEEVSTKYGKENSTVSNQNTENKQEIISNFVEQELQIQMLKAELISNAFIG